MSTSSLRAAFSDIDSPHIVSWEEGSERQFSLTLKGKSNDWHVNLVFPINFPYRLPVAELLDKHYIGRIPHVSKCGTICVEESDSILIDYERPKEIIECFIQEVVRLLARAKLKIYQDELLDEYEGYFSSSERISSFYRASKELEDVSLKVSVAQSGSRKELAKPILLFGKNNSLPKNFSNLHETNEFQIINVIHLPLLDPIFPPPNGADLSISYFEDIKGNISVKSKKKLDKRLSKERCKRQFFVLLSMPRSSGEHSQMLLEFKADKPLEHPIINSSEEWKLTPYLLNRNNKEYLLERGGANLSLANKTVAVIGCGSVGGEIAFMLAKAGVGKLVLIDDDCLESDNIYRHRLGGAHLNYRAEKETSKTEKVYKVNALASQLAVDMPYGEVYALNKKFELVIESHELGGANLFVVAVGSPMQNLIINKLLKVRGLNNVVFCWNEAAGYGGHALSLNLEETCLECTYTSQDGFQLESQFSLIQTGQFISKNITGCAGVFTPFSYLDSSQTAVLAAQLAVESLLGTTESKAITWKGAGNGELKVTQRYDSMPLKEQIDLQQKPNCRVCDV